MFFPQAVTEKTSLRLPCLKDKIILCCVPTKPTHDGCLCFKKVTFWGLGNDTQLAAKEKFDALARWNTMNRCQFSVPTKQISKKGSWHLFTFHKFQKSKRASGKSFSIMEKSAGLRKNESTSQSQSNDPMHFLVGKVRNGFGPIGQDDISSIKKRKFLQRTRSKKKWNLGINSTFYIHVHLVPEDNGRNLSCATICFLGFVPDQLLMLKMQIYTSVTIWTHLDHAVGLLQEEWRWCYAPRDVLRPHLKWKWCQWYSTKIKAQALGSSFFSKSNLKTFSFGSDFDKGCRFTEIPCQVDKQKNSAKSLQCLLYLCKCLEISISISTSKTLDICRALPSASAVSTSVLSAATFFNGEKNCCIIRLRSKHQASAIVVEGREVESQFPGLQAQQKKARPIERFLFITS